MSLTYTQHERMIEESNYEACTSAAEEDGHTVEEAENCEDGQLSCKHCPWKKEEK